MSWLKTCPSGSVKVCLAHYESDCAAFVLKKPVNHPVSIIDLTWKISAPPSIYRFFVSSWFIVEKNRSLESCSSPAGLFSFESDVDSGCLLSVSPGALDHGSLLTFFQKMQNAYPHRSRADLMDLAKQIAFDSAFEMVRPSFPLSMPITAPLFPHYYILNLLIFYNMQEIA